MSFSLLVYIYIYAYIFLLSALTPPLHVPCIRFAIICLTANIQPNFANGIHLLAKTKTTGKTEKTEKTIFFRRIYLPAKYGFSVFFNFLSVVSLFSFFGVAKTKKKWKNKKKLKKTIFFHRIYLPAKYVFFSFFSFFGFFGFGNHLLDYKPSTKPC